MKSFESAAQRMRRDWDARAAADAERFVYTHDAITDEADFDRSGKANYDQLVRPFLPILLGGRSAKSCRALEIGCGLGRMTRWFSRDFAAVDAIDVSPEMIRQARERMAGERNLRLHQNSGCDLAGFADETFDFAFSYIVFQHIPDAGVIANYVREAARVLKPGGAFKFQLNGDQSPAYRAHQRDTWLGETFSLDEARRMVEDAGLQLLASEGAGTQYFVLTARKGRAAHEAAPQEYVLPAEPWAAEQLIVGWGDAVDGSWRPVEPVSSARFAVAVAVASRFFLGLYIWPSEPIKHHLVRIHVDGARLTPHPIEGAGDHFLEWEVEPLQTPIVVVQIHIQPPCGPGYAPAVRCAGFYQPLPAD